MPIRIGWDKYETALLIDASERVQLGAPKRVIVKELSQELRACARSKRTSWRRRGRKNKYG